MIHAEIIAYRYSPIVNVIPWNTSCDIYFNQIDLELTKLIT